MDDSVLKALARWPNVPDVFNWLGLDRRGNWLLKDTPIGNSAITEFINRNYGRDEAGRWYFQNGPQRVYAALAYTPFVLRTGANTAEGELITHTGMRVGNTLRAWMDENGDLLFSWPSGIGLICDRDLPQIVSRITDAHGKPISDDVLENAIHAQGTDHPLWIDIPHIGRLPVSRIRSGDIAKRFGFNPDPQPAPGQADC